jgi:hypothetical protein
MKSEEWRMKGHQPQHPFQWKRNSKKIDGSKPEKHGNMPGKPSEFGVAWCFFFGFFHFTLNSFFKFLVIFLSSLSFTFFNPYNFIYIS